MANEAPNPGQYQAVADLLKQITGLSRELNLSEQATLDLEQQILDRKIKTGAQMKAAINDTVKLEATTRRVAQASQDVYDLQEQSAGMLKEMKNPMKLLGSAQADVTKKLKEEIKGQEQKLAKLVEAGNISAEQKKKIQENISANKSQLKSIMTINKEAPKLADQMAETSELVNGMSDGLNKFLGEFPGGGFLAKALGVNEMGEQFDKAATDGLAAVGSALEAGKSPMMAMKDGAAAFNKTLAINPLAIVALAAMQLYGIFKDMEESAGKMAEETGMTHAAAKNLVMESQRVAANMNTQLATAKEIQTVLSATASEFGTTAMLSAEQAANVADMGEAFGYGAEQAAEVNNQFLAMGASAEVAADAQGMVAKEAMMAGVNVGMVTKDIADNAADVSKYFKGNVKNLGKAAVEAAKMGVSLKTMANVTDKLLDFEESISAQFEFQALTGRQMNMDQARQLALKGDIAGATKEVMNQVGSLADLQALGPLEMEALEKATGMTSAELLKQATIQEKLGDLTDDQKAAMSGLNLTAAEMASKSPEQLKAMMAQEQQSKKIAAQFDNLKSTLVSALMPAADAMMSIFSAMTPILKGIGVILKLAFAPITIAMDGLASIKEALKSISGEGTILGDTFAYIGDLIGSMSEYISDFFAMIAENQTVMNILKAVFTFIALAAIPSMISGLITMAGAMIPLIAGALSTAAGFLMTAVGAIFSTFAAIPFGLGIPLAIAGIATLFGLFQSAKGNDVVSGPSNAGGSAGYGSRVLFGPEGAISFNNRDTIVAGTNLFGKANDAVFAPAGAMKMDDGAVGDMPDPPEAKVVGITNDTVIRLSTGIAVALGTAIVTALTTILPVSLGAALVSIMPVLGATMVASMVTAAAATAMIPKPVLIMNPVLLTFETNPIMMMGSFLGGLFGGGGKEESTEDPVIQKLEEVKNAIMNMDIKMDGERVGVITRIADTFRRK